jgi:hypothetical protein
MFCSQSLGSNQVVVHFPVGKRLVFDSERGRLWVVCRKCERWNLTPMEERWEAVEECERLFEVLKTRVSTEHIGLGRHPGGVDLVRIGQPQRPEFAAWRYGDQFGRRRTRALVYGTAGIAVFGGIVLGGAMTGVISGAILAQSGNFVNLWQNGRVLARLPMEDGSVLKLKNPDLQKARLVTDDDSDLGWALEVKKGKQSHRFEGDEARSMGGRLLPRVNRNGARKGEVQDAVRRIEEAGHPEAFLTDLGSVAARQGSKDRPAWNVVGDRDARGHIQKLPTPTRLALEMALHEEEERKALQGELAGLRAAWIAAEEIAEISDNLLLPEGTEEFLEQARAEDDPREG